MTRDAEAFTAGVLDSLPALTAITAPSVASYQRLQPHRWSGPWACWGRENREAAVRFVTGMTGNGAEAANAEVKCFDATANPYLVTGAVLTLGRHPDQWDALRADPELLPSSIEDTPRTLIDPRPVS